MPELIDINELSRRLHLKKSYIYKMRCEGTLPLPSYSPTPGRLLFSADDVEALILRGRAPSRDELAAQAEAILNAPRSRR